MPARNRLILGRDRDVAESANERTVCQSAFASASDFTLLLRMRHNAVEIARYHLGNKGAIVAYAYLRGRNWKLTGLKKSTFYKIQKKVKKLFALENSGRKRHLRRL